MEQGQLGVGQREGREVVGESRKRQEELPDNFNIDYRLVRVFRVHYR